MTWAPLRDKEATRRGRALGPHLCPLGGLCARLHSEGLAHNPSSPGSNPTFAACLQCDLGQVTYHLLCFGSLFIEFKGAGVALDKYRTQTVSVQGLTVLLLRGHRGCGWWCATSRRCFLGEGGGVGNSPSGSRRLGLQAEAFRPPAVPKWLQMWCEPIQQASCCREEHILALHSLLHPPQCGGGQ